MSYFSFLFFFFCNFLRKIIDDFHTSFQEVGSPVGRIVKNEEFLKAGGPAMVCNICIFFVLHFISCAMTHGYLPKMSVVFVCLM